MRLKAALQGPQTLQMPHKAENRQDPLASVIPASTLSIFACLASLRREPPPVPRQDLHSPHHGQLRREIEMLGLTYLRTLSIAPNRNRIRREIVARPSSKKCLSKKVSPSRHAR